jgi:tetratricopeptide (TPR) repeat protein
MLSVVGCSTMKTPSVPKFADRTPNAPEQHSMMVPGSDMAENREPKHPERVHVAYARWQEQQKQLPQARESYQKALDLDPKSVDALLGLSRLEQLAGRQVEAEKHLQKAQKLRPKDPLVHAAWGEYYSTQQQWGPAVKKYRDAIELAPDEPLYKHQLAIILGKSGDWEGALSAFKTIVTPGEAHYNVGYLQHQQGLLVESEGNLRLAVEAKPDLAIAATLLAKIQNDRQAKSAVARQEPTTPVLEPTIQPASWHSTDKAPVSRRPTEAAPPVNMTPQQLEQWRNQQSAALPSP